MVKHQKSIFLLLNRDIDLTTAELGNIPSQFFFAEETDEDQVAEIVFNAWYELDLEVMNLGPGYEKDEVKQDTRIIEIDPGKYYIKVWVWNSNCEDWEVDQAEIIQIPK